MSFVYLRAIRSGTTFLGSRICSSFIEADSFIIFSFVPVLAGRVIV
jgi:hypothetical protein